MGCPCYLVGGSRKLFFLSWSRHLLLGSVVTMGAPRVIWDALQCSSCLPAVNPETLKSSVDPGSHLPTLWHLGGQEHLRWLRLTVLASWAKTLCIIRFWPYWLQLCGLYREYRHCVCGHLPGVCHQHDRGALGLAAALCGTITRPSEQISASHRGWDALGWIALVSKRKSFQKNQPFPMLCGICPISMIIMGFQRKLKSGHEDPSADCGGR